MLQKVNNPCTVSFLQLLLINANYINLIEEDTCVILSPLSRPSLLGQSSKTASRPSLMAR